MDYSEHVPMHLCWKLCNSKSSSQILFTQVYGFFIVLRLITATSRRNALTTCVEYMYNKDHWSDITLVAFDNYTGVACLGNEVVYSFGFSSIYEWWQKSCNILTIGWKILAFCHSMTPPTTNRSQNNKKIVPHFISYKTSVKWKILTAI